MWHRVLAGLAAVIVLMVLTMGAPLAQEKAKDKESLTAEASAPMPRETILAEPEIVSSEHVLDGVGGPLAYTARAGELLVPLEGDEPKARFFFVAYEKKDAEPGERPVTFAFNGGPGASSVWLHMGALGPTRVDLNPDGTAPPPPAGFEDNPRSWLAFTDLVFIDPVGTGYSRPLKAPQPAGPGVAAPDEEEKAFWGVRQDVLSVASFIRLYLTRNDRWLSPVFLLGESYGGIRAAELTTALLDEHGIAARGVVYVSPVLDFTSLDAMASNLPFSLYLPSYAATAVFHGKAKLEKGEDLAARLQTIERFALERYLPALALGHALDDVEKDGRATLRKELARYTGLPERVVAQERERIRPGVFFKELLREEGKLVGRMDGSMTCVDPEPPNPFPELDPSLDSLTAAFTSAFNAYVRQRLGYRIDIPYTVLSAEVINNWDWSSGIKGRQGYVNTGGEVRFAMSAIPGLRVLFVCGYYDMATPYFATVWSVRQMLLTPEQRKNVVLRFYEGGHMLYNQATPREQLFQDAAAFYRESLP